MFLDKINAVANVESRFLPLEKLRCLDVNKSYLVTRLAKVTTKYGEKIIADLCGEKSVFLPGRLVKYFQLNLKEWDDLQKIISNNQLLITYLGGSWNNISFYHDGDDYCTDDSDDSDSDDSDDSEEAEEAEERPPTKKRKPENTVDLEETPTKKPKKHGDLKKLPFTTMKKHNGSSADTENSEQPSTKKSRKIKG